jgi:hypothetical protein
VGFRRITKENIMKRSTRSVSIVAVLAVAALAGCSEYNDDRGKGDAPVGSSDDSPAVVINFPDGFANVARKCDGPNAVYTHTREAAPVVVANSPVCTGAETDG